MTVVDMHCHLLTQGWVDQIKKHGAPEFGVAKRVDGVDCLVESGTMTMTLEKKKFDYAGHVRAMDESGIDVSVLSLTSPNVMWGDAKVSAETAKLLNDGFAKAQSEFPGRLRWLASIPWEHPALALGELKRAGDAGAVGVVVLANIRGKPLTHPDFAAIWAEIDRRKLAVFCHPSNPPGAEAMEMKGGIQRLLLPTVGFLFDTTLAVARMIFDGFFDRYPNLKFIAAHGGGTLPFIASRIDLFYSFLPPAEKKLGAKPGEYLRHIYYDAIVYHAEALRECINLGGAGHVLFGTDYPHSTDVPGLLANAKTLKAKERGQVLGKNAETLFNL
jgi:aminocarboxymuconate-semialdehyde decarboxylase